MSKLFPEVFITYNYIPVYLSNAANTCKNNLLKLLSQCRLMSTLYKKV